MKNDWNIDRFPNYLLGTFDEAVTQPKVDLLIRVSGSTDEDMEFCVTGTERFKSHFGNIFESFKVVKDTLVEVILSQRRSLEYNGFYNAFLMGQMGELEFEKIAKTFTYKPKTINMKVLSSKVNILFNLTKIDYSTSELADIFQCNSNDVVTAIRLITGNNPLREAQ
jgi:hypothetical protein